MLIGAIIERERDPTSSVAFDRFDRAAQGFENAGDAELELVALAQLGYLARVGGDPARIEPVMQRMAALAERHPPARPFLAFGEAWKALAIGRPDLQLAALERITDEELPAVWEVSRDHLIAHALFNLGRPDEALARVPAEIDTLPIPIPGALVTESQCYWYAGQPDVALDVRSAGLSARHGARDRFIAGAWIAGMRAYAGQVDEARKAMRIAEQHVGEQPALMLTAQLVAVQLLIKLSDGDERAAAADLAAILDVVPLGGGVSEQLLRNHLTLPYVLVPTTRDYWDHADLGPAHIRARDAVAAFVRARENGDLAALATMLWPDPGFLAANFPFGGRSNSRSAVCGPVATRAACWRRGCASTGETLPVPPCDRGSTTTSSEMSLVISLHEPRRRLVNASWCACSANSTSCLTIIRRRTRTGGASGSAVS